MAVKVQISGPMRQHTNGQSTVEGEGADLRALIDNLSTRYPGLKERIIEGDQVRRFVNVLVNNEDIRYLDNLATLLKDGDDVAIIPAVAGG